MFSTRMLLLLAPSQVVGAVLLMAVPATLVAVAVAAVRPTCCTAIWSTVLPMVRERGMKSMAMVIAVEEPRTAEAAVVDVVDLFNTLDTQDFMRRRSNRCIPTSHLLPTLMLEAEDVDVDVVEGVGAVPVAVVATELERRNLRTSIESPETSPAAENAGPRQHHFLIEDVGL